MSDQATSRARANSWRMWFFILLLAVNFAGATIHLLTGRWRLDFRGVTDLVFIAFGLIALGLAVVAVVGRLRTGVWTWP